jgi:pyridoxamine 5'-phosphate oxidase
MTKDEIIKFMNSHPACHIATAEKDGQPHVRGMLMYRADDQGVLFHTGDFKDLWGQVTNNPKMEICFFDQKTGTQVRVIGTAEPVDDPALKQEIVNARPFLKAWVEKHGYEPLKVFRIKPVKATVWTFETNFDPKEYIDL